MSAPWCHCPQNPHRWPATEVSHSFTGGWNFCAVTKLWTVPPVHDPCNSLCTICCVGHAKNTAEALALPLPTCSDTVLHRSATAWALLFYFILLCISGCDGGMPAWIPLRVVSCQTMLPNGAPGPAGCRNTPRRKTVKEKNSLISRHQN